MPRMLFLFSDTGGGHRSAAEAVQEALVNLTGSRADVQLVDFLRAYAPPPFSRFPEMYPDMVKVPAGWGLGYQLSNGPRRARFLCSLVWPFVRRSLQRFYTDLPVDLVVSFHPLANDVISRMLVRLPQTERPPFVVVVTDLVSTHAFWYHRAADLTIVPTEPARDRALACGLITARVRVAGLPVAEKFCRPTADSSALRAALGWDAGRRIVLIVGGGDGMGPLEQTARAVAGSGLDAGIAVVTGRNTGLRARLEAADWPVPAYIYGFVKNMPDLMQAADVLVTKAGPGTVSEALNAGLPTILYSYLPGQEAGNVTYLVEHGAGIWAPTPGEVVAGLRGWFEKPAAYEEAARAARSLARPDAARQIAGLLLEQIKG